MRKALLFVLSGMVLCGGTLAFLAWPRDLPGNFSERPPRSGTAKPLPVRNSEIGSSFTISLVKIRDVINSNIPKEAKADGREHLCRRIGPYDPRTGIDLRTDVCADLDWDVTAKIPQAAGLTYSSGASRPFRLTIPISFEGKAGFSGDLARALSLNGKNFNGAVSAYIDFGVDINSDWCPVVDTKTSYRWTENAKLEIIGGVWVDVAANLNSPLQDALERAVSGIPNAVNCESIRDGVKGLWKVASFDTGYSIEKDDSERPINLFVHNNPQSLSFTGFTVAGDSLSAAVKLTTQIEVSDKRRAEVQKALPSLRRMPAGGDEGVNVAVPLRLTYYLVQAHLYNLIGQEFRDQTAAGDVVLKVDELTVFPSNGRIVVGLKLNANLPGNWFDTAGWVYVFAEPVVDRSLQKIYLKNIGFTRVLDNGFWNATSAVLRSKIVQALQRNAAIDLTARIEEMERALSKAVQKENEKGKSVLSYVSKTKESGIGAIVLGEATIDTEIILRLGSVKIRFLN